MENTLKNNNEEESVLVDNTDLEVEVIDESVNESAEEVQTETNEKASETNQQASEDIKELLVNQAILVDIVRAQSTMLKNILKSVEVLNQEIEVLNDNSRINMEYNEKAIQNINMQNNRCNEMLSVLTESSIALDKLSSKQVSLENNQDRVTKALGKCKESVGVIAEDLVQAKDKIEKINKRNLSTVDDVKELREENQEIKAKLSILDTIKKIFN